MISGDARRDISQAFFGAVGFFDGNIILGGLARKVDFNGEWANFGKDGAAKKGCQLLEGVCGALADREFFD